MNHKLRPALILILALSWIPKSQAQPAIEDSVVQLIKQYTVEDGQVMEHARMMTDVHGPRLTGSPGLEKASAWAVEQLEAWGLSNVGYDEWGPFGKGWTLNRFSMNVTEPTSFPVIAFPKAWSSGTDGVLAGEIYLVNIEDTTDFDRYRGTLKGRIVMISQPAEIVPDFDGGKHSRRTDTELLSQANAPMPKVGASTRSQARIDAARLRTRINNFIYNEEPAAILDRSYKGDHGTIAVSQARVPAPSSASYLDRPSAWDLDRDHVIPQISIGTEHYNRMYRLAKAGETLEVAFELDVTWHDDDPMEANIIAEIPGTDPDIEDEVVMLGAHFDSWHSGTGATDNAAGSSVMMEVMRVLKKIYDERGTTPRRTIRLALWTGEEQGLLGSRAYVANHLAVAGASGHAPIATSDEWSKVSAYYNLDNGTGQIRGVYLQGNSGVQPIFRDWLKPFKEYGTETLSLANTGGTDHFAFDAVGIPGFQFIQDHAAYSPLTHHTNMDVFDNLIADDLKKSAAIIATFVYNTAERDAMLPRKEFVAAATSAGSN